MVQTIERGPRQANDQAAQITQPAKKVARKGELGRLAVHLQRGLDQVGTVETGTPKPQPARFTADSAQPNPIRGRRSPTVFSKVPWLQAGPQTLRHGMTERRN